MKNNILKLVGFFIALAFLASCENEAFEEYSSVPVADAPGLTLTIDSNTDSAITVSYNMDMAGRVTLAVLPASVDTPSLVDMKARDTDDYYYYKHDEGEALGTITYEGLEPYTEYIVYGVGQNLDGVFSEIINTEAVRTEDFVNPELVSYTPVGQDPPVASDQPIVLTFSENVEYDNTKEVVFSAYFSGIDEVIPEDSISISGNEVTINWGILPYNDYCFISYEEGAFTDYSDNPVDEVVSGVIGGFLEGIWFLVETDPSTQLSEIFENFLGEYECTDYLNDDSTTVDWGPYEVTITEDPDVEYGVIIDNFWAWGITAKFQFNTDGTITCSEQLLDVSLGDVWGNSDYDDYGVWLKGWSPDIYTIPVGHWDYSDFSFDIALAFITDYEAKMQAYSDIYQSYEKPSGKALVAPKK
ncbi:MAG: Ig-like domain-containing protein [Thiohalospira sp.]